MTIIVGAIGNSHCYDYYSWSYRQKHSLIMMISHKRHLMLDHVRRSTTIFTDHHLLFLFGDGLVGLADLQRLLHGINLLASRTSMTHGVDQKRCSCTVRPLQVLANTSNSSS